MSRIPTMEDLEDKLCSSAYCPYMMRGGSPGVTGGPNGPISCEGSYCDRAYESWKEENIVTCCFCKEVVCVDECVVQVLAKGLLYICGDCQ